MTIINHLKGGLYSLRSNLGGIIAGMIERGASNAMDDLYPEAMFSSRLTHRAGEIEVGRNFATSVRVSSELLRKELLNYDPNKDEHGVVLQTILLKSKIEKLRADIEIYVREIDRISGPFGDERKAGRYRKQVEEMNTKLKALETNMPELDPEWRDLNPEDFEESIADMMVGESEVGEFNKLDNKGPEGR